MDSKDRNEIAYNARKLYSKESMTRQYLSEYDNGGKKQKILLLDVNYKFSSTGKIVYDLCQCLKKEGRKVAVCYGRGKKIREDNVYKFGIDFETIIHALLARVTGYNGCFSPLSTRRLINYIDSFNPDIIHIHELHAYFVNIKSLLNYINQKNIKIIWTFHCEYMYTGKCGHAYSCVKFQTECNHCPLINDYPKSYFFDRTRKMFQMKKRVLNDLEISIVTPSLWLANRVKKSFLKKKSISIIYNGIDTSIFQPMDSRELRVKVDVPDDYKIALFVSPNIMNEKKGGKWVLELAQLMANNKIIFLMIGGGSIPQSYHSNIKFIGEVEDSKELAKYYSMADVYLIFSERETYSMTCAEALCCGTPVIGFECGAPETIFTEPYAYFVRYGDIDAIKYRLIEMMDLDE